MIDLEEHSEELGYDIDFVIEYLTRYGEIPPERLDVIYLGSASDTDERLIVLGKHEAQFTEYQDLVNGVLDYKTVGESALGVWTLMNEWAWK